MFEKINVKHRHVMTPEGNLRLRYIIIAGITCISILIIGLLCLGHDDSSPKISQNDTKISTVAEIVENITPNVIKELIYDPEQAGNGMNPFLSRIGTRPYFNKPYNYFSTITVESGDILGLLIEETGLKGQDYMSVMAELKDEFDPTSILPGDEISVTYERLGTDSNVRELSYIFDALKSVHVTQNDNGAWVAETKERPVQIRTHAVRTKVENSIYGSMGRDGVPDGIINAMIKGYSWTVDFQRDIWGGEEIEVLYETKETDNADYVRSNRLLYANLKLRNREMPVYLFEKDKGYPTYFEPDGQSIKRALMKTPIDGARLSSGYGSRRHPVLGYKKMHKGVDFAAPTGTPIYAAGDGVVQRANRFSSFGNYIKIKHNNTYSTAYAHLNGFAKGIRSGSRVKQGQVIGYVGTTGRSTGPHLHYEVHKNGKAVNPHSVDLPLGEQLKGTNLANFKNIVGKRDQQFRSLLIPIVATENDTGVNE